MVQNKAVIAGTETPTKIADKKVLSFPTQVCVGSLLLVPEGGDIDVATQVSGAQGKVSVTVPPNKWLIFEVNQKVFLHPELLDAVSVAGIDAMRVSLLSMSTDEELLCDRLLGHVKRFGSLKRLVVDHSDASDAGISQLSNLSDLTYLSAKGSQVRGSFLCKLMFPKLSSIDLRGCKVDPNAFPCLSKYSNLNQLGLGQTELDNTKLKGVVRCLTLTDLDISDNPKMDDESLKMLPQLKHLDRIGLHRTHITAQGLKVLQPLKLKYLSVPKTFTPEEVARVQAWFPSTRIRVQGTGTGRQKDIDVILAPISK